MIDDAEYYFIQFLFCKNRDLLRKDNREFYDALFTRYLKVYNEGIKKHISIGDIDDVFQRGLFKK